MTLTLGINGFGRIGRAVLRAILESGRTDLKVVAINDLAPAQAPAHLLEFDSVHGRLPRPVTLSGDTLDAGTGPIRVTAERDPAALPWQNVDIALECTGLFRSAEEAGRHLKNGSGKVLISAPAKGTDIPTIVMGVNDERLTETDLIVSNGSCTTNCLAPVLDLIDRTYGIERGMMTTVHAYTGDQPTHDRPHSDLARARAGALSMIPTSTGAADAIGLVLPQLEGRLTGQAIRVPTPNVSAVDVTVQLRNNATVADVNALFTKAAAGPLKGILDVESRPLVSRDFNHTAQSSIVALDQTRVQDGTLLRVLSWYDNEWGFSNRMLDMAAAMGARSLSAVELTKLSA